jgi:hypothetical protein
MTTVITFLALIGYSAGFEGYDNGKVHIGFYTPNHEYIWAVTKDEIYLDVIVFNRP